MSLRKKDVYSTLSDYGRKVLGKSRSQRAKSFNKVECGLAVKDCHTILSDKSRLEARNSTTSSLDLSNGSNSETLSNKNIILLTPTPPNSPNYKCIENSKPIIKTIEEPDPLLETKKIDKQDRERTSFQLCKIM